MHRSLPASFASSRFARFAGYATAAPRARGFGIGHLVGEEGPSILTMVGVVAVVVAAVILVFFAIGYLLGRILL
jgi:hypothetical protein